MYVLEWKGEKNHCTQGWNIILVFDKVCFTLVLDLYFLNRVINNKIISRFSVSNVVTYNWAGGVKY